MEKINFEDGQLVNAGYVEIDGVQHEVHEAEYQGNTPLSAYTLNKMQDNIEKELNSTKTIQGESITIEDSCNCKAHLKVYGKTIKEGNVIRNVGDNVNLFDKDNAESLNIYSWDNSTLDNGANIFKSIYIPCKPNTTYTVQKRIGQRFVLTTTAEIPAIGVQTYGFVIDETASKLSITTPNNAKYLIVEHYRGNKDTLTEQEILDSIKIEEGSVATSYSKYGCGTIEFEKNNETISFPLSEGLRLHEGDYLADDGIHQKKNTRNLSMITWEFLNTRTNTILFSSLNLSNIKDIGNVTGIDILSNCFISGDVYNKDIEGIEQINKKIFISINKNKLETQNVEGLTKYLANNNAIMEYKLEEEKIIPYTTEQYNELRLMSEGQNTITTVGDVKPNIECNYYYNNDLNKAYADRFDELEIKTMKNENGTATMFPDGTMICRKKIELGKLAYTTAYGTIFTTNNTHIWNFPIAFINDDISINLQAYLGGGIGGVTLNKNIGKDKIDFFIYSVREINNLDTNIYATAIGRWK